MRKIFEYSSQKFCEVLNKPFECNTLVSTHFY